MTRLDFSSTVDVSSACPPVMTPMNSRMAKATRQEHVEPGHGLALIVSGDRDRLDARHPHHAVDRGTVESLGLDSRADDRFAKALVNLALDAVVHVRRHEEIVVAVPAARRPSRRRGG